MALRIHELFGEALDQPEGTRLEWLRARCGNDAEAFSAAMALLAADSSASLLDGEVAAFAEPLIKRADVTVDDDATRYVGMQFGAYSIRQLLGRGGMGSVWLAERQDGAFQQQVAIKLIAGALPSAQSLERFVRERQILARLQHPNIARVRDGGERDGAPWFAMDYVDGVAVDAYCARHALSLDARLVLFVKIVDAVQYAHRNLIVHRDLKPSNVLVDADGEPHLLDFGVAKLIDDDIEATASRAPLSLAYAAPEQIVGDSVTTATDVYALGVMLFELLTGTRPHHAHAGSGIALLHAITDKDAQLASRTAITRGVPDAQRLKGDLDTIIQKCLSREPLRRYDSAAALARDIERFSKGLPIEARPDSARYRFGKFIWRHRLGSAFAATALMGVLASTAISFQQAQRARAAAEAAQQERDVALAEVRHQEALSEHFNAVLNMASAHGEQVAVSQLMAWAADPGLLGEINDAGMRLAIDMAVSDLLLLNNDFPGALALLDKLAPQWSVASPRAQLKARTNLALAQIRSGDMAGATLNLDAAQVLLPEGSRSITNALIRNYRGQILRASGDLAAAARLTRESAAMGEAAEDATPLMRGKLVANAGSGLLQLGDLDGALKFADAGVRIWNAGGVRDNSALPSALAIGATAQFLRGDIQAALAQFDALAAQAGFTESVPARAARDLTRAKALALLDHADAADALSLSAMTAMCKSVGESSLDCLRAELGRADTALIAKDLATAKAMLTRADAQLVLQPIAPLQAVAKRLRTTIALLEAPSREHVDALIAQIEQSAQPGLAQRNEVRNLLVVAEQLRERGHIDAATRCARAAISAAASLGDVHGMDASLLALWTATLADTAPAPSALDGLAATLGAAHPWVSARK